MKRIGGLLLALLLAAALTVPVLALGDDVDFGGGGGYDSGGYYDSGRTYYGGSTYYNSDGGDVDADSLFWVIVVSLALVGVIAVAACHTNSPSASVKQIDEESLRALREHDPQFSAAQVEAEVKRWVTQFEIAWCDGDMTPQRDFIADSLFDTYQNQLAMMRQNWEASRSEDLAVLDCTVERWRQDGAFELLDVWLREKKRTYKVDWEDRGKLVKGNAHTVYQLDYRWQLIRPARPPGAGGGAQPFGGSHEGWRLNKVDKLAQQNH